MNSLYLGIDTSNYKTSAAVVDEEGNTIAEKSVLLDVPEGKRGLRQSEAFFMHSNRLPGYLHEILGMIDIGRLAGVGVSDRPRRVEGSYMPCFMAGLNAALLIGESRRLPVFRFSHQEGHAAAVLEGRWPDSSEDTVFFHLSGGTTETLLCRPDAAGYKMRIVGGTLDISIGQLFDRFGVASGFQFPAGRYLDDLAYGYLEAAGFDTDKADFSGIMPSIKIKDGYFNLSGAETRLMRSVSSEEADTARTAAELFAVIADLLHREASYLCNKYGTDRAVMAGGAASSRTIRKLLSCKRDPAPEFGDPELSGDNAVGIARLAKRMYETGNCISGK